VGDRPHLKHIRHISYANSLIAGLIIGAQRELPAYIKRLKCST